MTWSKINKAIGGESVQDNRTVTIINDNRVTDKQLTLNKKNRISGTIFHV